MALRSASSYLLARRLLALATAPVLLLSVAGCSRSPAPLQQRSEVARAGNSRPVSDSTVQNGRRDALEHARRSCIQSATVKAGNKPGQTSKIESYCDCFTREGVGKLSDAQLTAVGQHKGQLTPEERATLNNAVQHCRSEMK